jgi:3-mercaptopyruvate sulfurtransferase SseA
MTTAANSSPGDHASSGYWPTGRIGLREATDLDGGFQAWKTAGLPTSPA